MGKSFVGCGAVIAVTDKLVCSEEPILTTMDCEIIWLKIKGRCSLMVCAYYRPQTNDEPSLTYFAKFARLASTSKNAVIVIRRDFNLPGWDWANKTLKSGKSLHHAFVDNIQYLNMEQMVQISTREINTLDLFLTNCSKWVQKTERKYSTNKLQKGRVPPEMPAGPRQSDLPFLQQPRNNSKGSGETPQEP